MINLDDIQGHWSREWIKAPGFEDHATRVHWMQVGDHYADVRVPLARPSLSNVQALSDLPAEVLADLAQAEGFAGTVTLEGSHCTWHRAINWHGAPDGADVGAISFDDEGRMIEAGVLADYTELWQQLGGDAPEVLRFEGGGYEGYAVTRGGACVMGIGVPGKPATRPLVEALKQGKIPDGIEALFGGLHALCEWSGDQLIAKLATQPFCEGAAALTRSGQALTWHRLGFDGARHEIEMTLQPVPA